jgi:hypothetical protein
LLCMSSSIHFYGFKLPKGSLKTLIYQRLLFNV